MYWECLHGKLEVLVGNLGTCVSNAMGNRSFAFHSYSSMTCMDCMYNGGDDGL